MNYYFQFEPEDKIKNKGRHFKAETDAKAIKKTKWFGKGTLFKEIKVGEFEKIYRTPK